jgi:hypothetical protein
MAYPVVETSNYGYNNTAGTSHTVNLPASIAAGDLLIVFFGYYTGTVSTPGGWETMGTENNGTSVYQAIFYKTASGSEGSTLTVTTGSSTKSSHVSYRISGWTGTPEKGSVATGTDSAPNPPSLTPSWGSAETLWIVNETNRNNSFSTYPTNYSSNQVRGGNTSTTSATETSAATREVTASSENPGAYGLSTSRYWLAQTVAIQPAPAIEAIGPFPTHFIV